MRLVLLVDDEATIRHCLAEELREAQFTVVEASSADEALHRIRDRGPIFAAVTDLNLGRGPDGITVLTEVGLHHPEAVRILITGQDDHRVTLALREGLCARVILKPLRPNQLISAVDTLTG